MTNIPATEEQWRSLYQAAIRFKKMAPWDWMTEMDVFGVQDPQTEDLGFISIMGRYGEHYALALYLGPFGLYSYWTFVDYGEEAPAEMILEIPHLQASFEDRNVLTNKDRQQIKALEFKFRGRNAWPMFRSYRPGYVPWYLEGPEVRFLTHALEQALDIAPRCEKDPKLLEPTGDYDYLVRVPRYEADTLIWQDQMMTVLPPEPESTQVPMDLDVLDAVQRLPRSRHRLEIDFFMAPMWIEERGERPYFPYMLLVVDADSGLVLHNDLLELQTTREDLWGALPLRVVHLLAHQGSVPREIRVQSPLLYNLLELLLEELGFELKHVSRLPKLESTKEFLLSRFT